MSIDNIRESLNRAVGFWDSLNKSFDYMGFDESYISKFVQVGEGKPSKFFKDSVWGMMEFGASEVALINSPIVQRLRKIYQLGFTYLTYPSAEHSRFSHTLGVAHVVKKLISAIEDSSKRQNRIDAGGEQYPLYNPRAAGEEIIVRSLVHAAILHDCGHLGFSHAGESAFTFSHDVSCVGGIPTEDFLYIFREQEFDSDLSECLSIAVCLSPRFERFYAKVISSTEVRKRIDELCLFIGGKAYQPEYSGLANIISGAAVDADKIDYLNRDARECGIPVGVDISRVFLNTSVIKIDKHQAGKLANPVDPESTHGFLHGWQFIVNSTGLDTYDELASAKSILYNRVYLHQLTRNAERVFAKVVRDCCSLGGENNDVLHWYRFGDEELLARLESLPELKDSVRRLSLRELPKRAFVVFRDACMTVVKMQDLFERKAWLKKDSDDYLDKFNNDFVRLSAWKLYDAMHPSGGLKAPTVNRTLTELIRDEAVKLRVLTDEGFDHSSLRSGEPFIGFSPRYISKPVPEVLVREKNAITYSWNWSKSEELTTAEHVSKGADYFYCDPEWKSYVAIAVLKVLFSFNSNNKEQPLRDEGDFERKIESSEIKYIQRLAIDLQQIANRIGHDYSALLDQMHKAAQKGYFGAQSKLVPLQSIQQSECAKIAARFKDLNGERGWRVSEQLVEAFARQFPVELRTELLVLLNNAIIIDRGQVELAFRELIEGMKKGGDQHVVLCPLTPNSGNSTARSLEVDRRNDFEGMGHKFARSLDELEAELSLNPTASILFVDDQFATGAQVHAQILHWAGIQSDKWPEELRSEKNINFARLSEALRTKLQKNHVVLGFVYGTEAGKKRIEVAARDNGFENLSVRSSKDLEAIRPKVSQELQHFLERVGFALLARAKFGDQAPTKEQETALRSNALGSLNYGSWLTNLSGAPAHAVTALWHPGVFEGEAWLPIFLRRGYKKFLVLN